LVLYLLFVLIRRQPDGKIISLAGAGNFAG